MKELIEKIRAFNKERDWDQFHSPKNLAMALMVETAELAEHFQWMDLEESRSVDEATKAKLKEEIGDVVIYLLNLCDKLDIDPIAVARDKLAINSKKYPVDRSRGKATKYTDF